MSLRGPIPVYIAAPYSGPNPLAIGANVAEAVWLCREAVVLGRAPVCVHPVIQAGGYGNDDDPDERERGLQVSLALVRMVAGDPRGEFWALTDDQGLVSIGVQRELHEFQKYGSTLRVSRRSKSEWRRWLREALLRGGH